MNSIYQLLLFPFHLFSLTLFLLLCFIVGENFQTKNSKNDLKLKWFIFLGHSLIKMADILVSFSELNGLSWQGCWLLSCSRSIIVNYANTNTNTHIITQRVIMPISFLKNGNKNNISMVNRPRINTTMGLENFLNLT